MQSVAGDDRGGQGADVRRVKEALAILREIGVVTVTYGRGNRAAYKLIQKGGNPPDSGLSDGRDTAPQKGAIPPVQKGGSPPVPKKNYEVELRKELKARRSALPVLTDNEDRALSYLEGRFEKQTTLRYERTTKDIEALRRILARFEEGKASGPIGQALDFAYEDTFFSSQVVDVRSLERLLPRLLSGLKTANAPSRDTFRATDYSSESTC